MPAKVSEEEKRQIDGPENGKRSPGRPRSEAARRAILRSTLRLLRTAGFGELSIEAIAADANVGKATVYRWWPNKGALVVDAFSSSVRRQLLFPDTGSVYSDMSLQMSHLVQLMLSPRGQIVAALIGGGQTDPDLISAFRERFVRPRRKEAYQTLRKGIERGELPPDADLDLILDSLYGAIYMRFLIWKVGLNDAFIQNISKMVLDGARQRSDSSARDREPQTGLLPT
ncbi:MAG TPA: TetR/AcrR family transcriptional regulator [Candidatus Binatia bacterium]|jgi:AcrR family transcriptional regulator|nr:TetR/AcrR family transcriptional regulator [Candidatus Binatia bacterium]